ncbi:MAG: glycosyltransferase [Pyrinomonadaceae bacterium]|nr:glycosyltransferase [Pyrinomonadaceae bacterium]
MTWTPLYSSRTANKNPPADIEGTSAQTAIRPIKVMYIINDLSIGGAEMMLYKLLAETDRTRFCPVVISLMHHAALRQRIEALGIAVYTTKMRPGRPTPMGLWRLVRLIRRLKPDLILGWMYHSCLAAQLANLFSSHRAQILWSIHYSISSLNREKRLTAAAIRVCAFLSSLPAKIVFVSQAAQLQHQSLGYSLESSCVIPNGIDVTEFVPSNEARSSVRSELGLPENAFLIGLLGRYHPTKDHANFLRAAALLSRLHPEVHFLLIGPKVDRENRTLCKSIQELGLIHQTHLLGERHDVPRLAAALDVFSLSSYVESCPNVIGEAMACGVPCVVTDVGDAAWILGHTGRVVPPRDSGALADAWREMIDLGPGGRLALGREARTRVIERFTLKSVAARYDAIYETVLAREKTRESADETPGVIGTLSTTFEDKGAVG